MSLDSASLSASTASPAGAAPAWLEATRIGLLRGRRPIFRNLDVTLQPGELLQVRGANGSGKTSLLRVLGGLLAPAEGEMRWHGRRVRGGDPDYLGALAYIGHANGTDADLSGCENLHFLARLAGAPARPEAVAAALAAFGLRRDMHAPVRTLSQGQRRRVALARLLLVPRCVWLLDEPTTSLDDASAAVLVDALRAHLASGGMAVVATHAPLALPGRVLELASPA